MKKNSFLEGAMIATVGIIICKIIGLFYVIPFYAIIGTQGGALYSYAYSIYAIFLSLSNSGIPIAISKVIGEYSALGYHQTKERAYKIGTTLIVSLGVFFFIVLMIFAPMIAKAILGNAVGGNTVSGVTFVIRVVATALLVVPIKSVSQGYLQGQKFILPSSIANVIEQIVRVIVIIVGSFATLKVFHLSLETAVGIAVFGATIGALSAYFYLLRILSKNRKKLYRDETPRLAERSISNKSIFKKIVLYALPFVVIDVMNSAYGMVDTMTVVNTMNKLGYSTTVAETSIGVLTTWATKLNMIIASIALGVTTSLIPNIASANAKKDHKDLNRKTNQALQALLFTTLPMTIGLSFLSFPVWIIFYGYEAISISIFQIFIFQAISFSFFTVLINIMQTLNCSKLTLGTLAGSFLAKAVLNNPMMILFDRIGLPAYYAPIATTLLTQSISTVFLLYQLKKRYNIGYFPTVRVGLKTVLATISMLFVLKTLSLVVPIETTSRLSSILVIALYGSVGATVYLLASYKSKLLYNIFRIDMWLLFKRKFTSFTHRKHS